MHPIMVMTHWSHHLHENMQYMRHQVSEHLRSRHFWAGVGVALLVIGAVALLFMSVMNAPVDSGEIHTFGLPYVPYH